MIVIVFGLPGSGKSYFASRLSSLINADYISSDRVRKQMFDEVSYSLSDRLSVYEEMLVQMQTSLKQKRNVVLDASFHRKDFRKKFQDHVQKTDVIRFIEILANESMISERLKESRPDSDADFAVYKTIKDQWEPLDEPHLILQSTNDNIGKMLDKTAEYLH